jgi:outer membrane lipoprotein-sorting protein
MKRLLALLVLLGLAVSGVTAQTATEIVKKSLDQFKGETSKATMSMEIIRPTWSRKITMEAWSKGEDYSLIKILSPARDEGTGFLKRKKEIWNWQPSIERTIKLPPSMMSQSWMGSDFTNDDLVREASVLTDYDHTILGTETIDGREAWKIQMIPKPDAPVVWGKVIAWITKDLYLELRAEFYDEEGELINVMEAGDIKTLGGRTIPTRMEMIPADEEGHKTVVIYEDIDYDLSLADAFFSIQNMKNVR